jgi:hypothetical protein
MFLVAKNNHVRLTQIMHSLTHFQSFPPWRWVCQQVPGQPIFHLAFQTSVARRLNFRDPPGLKESGQLAGSSKSCPFSVESVSAFQRSSVPEES